MVKVTRLTDIPGFEEADAQSYERGTKVVLAYCRENETAYYGRPKESFCVAEAIRFAESENKKEVVVDNMS